MRYKLRFKYLSKYLMEHNYRISFIMNGFINLIKFALGLCKHINNDNS